MLRFVGVAAVAVFAFTAGGALFAAEKSGAAEKPAVSAPALPDTDIFVGRVAAFASRPVVGRLRNVTDRPGYDNQPSFLPHSSAFYYVAEGETGKTDIRRYDIESGADEAVFISGDQSEYSPKAAGAFISFIQEDPSGEVTRVYKRPADGSAEGAPVADFAPLGYYAWLENGAALGVYYRSDPGSLYTVDIASGEAKLVQQKIGRTLTMDKAGDHLWFTIIVKGGKKPVHRLARYAPKTGEIREFFDLPRGVEDFALIMGDDDEAAGVIVARGASLLSRSLSDKEKTWTEIENLESYGIRNATRLSLGDTGWIAIVGEMAH
jgi:hypothetical protein